MTWRVPGFMGKFGTAAKLWADKDSTLAADSDAKVATQKAVKAYIATAISTLVTGPGSAVADNFATFNGTTGKIVKDSGLSLDTSTSLSANSDSKIPSQKAVKAYVDALLAAQDAFVFKGVINCSANPNYPAADAGHTYKVSVAGKIGGASGTNVEAGDTLYCITDGSAAGTQASVGANWTIVQQNIDGAVTGQSSSVDGEGALFSGTSGKIIKRLSATGILKAVSGVISAATAGTDYMKPDTSSSLSAGFYDADSSQGTKSSGTFTPDPASMPNMISYTNGGSHTLAPWTVSNKNATMIIDITNNGSAGVITTSGFTKVDGDAFDSTNGSKFRCYVSNGPAGSHLNVKKMA